MSNLNLSKETAILILFLKKRSAFPIVCITAFIMLPRCKTAIGSLRASRQRRKTPAGRTYRLSSAGDSLWSRMDTRASIGADICRKLLEPASELPSGSIVACGYSQRFDETTFWGWLIKVDQNGGIDTLLVYTE